jgi:hypothetical protein
MGSRGSKAAALSLAKFRTKSGPQQRRGSQDLTEYL